MQDELALPSGIVVVRDNGTVLHEGDTFLGECDVCEAYTDTTYDDGLFLCGACMYVVRYTHERDDIQQMFA